MSKIYRFADDVFKEYRSTNRPSYQYTIYKDEGLGNHGVTYCDVIFSLDQNTNIHIFTVKESILSEKRNKPHHFIIPKKSIKTIKFSNHWRGYFYYTVPFSFFFSSLFIYGLDNMQAVLIRLLIGTMIGLVIFSFLLSILFYSRQIKIVVWDGPTFKYMFPNCFRTHKNPKVIEAKKFEEFIKKSFLELEILTSSFSSILW